MNIAIIGSNGFIGKNLIYSLLKKNFKVYGFDRQACDPISENPNFYFYPFDVTGSLDILLDLAPHSIDVVIFAASLMEPAEAESNPIRDIQINTCAFVNLLIGLSDKFTGKFIFLSSGGTIYGNKKNAVETDPPQPNSIYSISKLHYETLLAYYSNKSNFSYLIFRLSNPFGSFHPKSNQGIIPIFINKILSHSVIDIYGDGNQTRDYFYIKNFTDFIDKTFNYSGDYYFYNIGSGLSLTVHDILDKIQAILNINPIVRHHPKRPFDLIHNSLCCDLAKNELGWNNEIMFDDALKLTIKNLLP